MHARAAAPAGPVLPLVLCHGWPDSFWRYAKVIPLLTDPGAHGADPADAFDVVVPDMPGYGYSDRPAGPPLDSIAVAGLWAELMGVLGYPRFGAAGGDIGSHVSRYLGLDHPGRVVAVHRTDAGLPVFTGDPADLAPEERAWLEGAAAWGAAEGAYAAMHRTKPQTAAFGLTDSPAGLAAWIVEKLRAWSDCDGDVERRFTKDEILTNVTLYWLTGTIGSSMRMYHANAAIPPAQHARRVEVPSGFSLFPGDIVRPPRAWLERTANVVRVTEPARGGHFAPFEEPELYAEELRAFFRPYRPADAFDVVVPDMPGYGYSDRPIGPALDSIAVAGLWAELMGVLGYARFGAAGGDIGSHVSRYLALDHPDRVVAVHRTDAGVPVFTGDPADLAPEERAWIEGAAAWGATEGAYAAMHRTKPQTAAFGLTDSPAGLAAWIVEKLRAWSDCDGDVERRFTKDEILTNVTLYWLTGTIGSSMRMYRANAAIPPAQLARRVEVPSGFSLFPGDIVRPPRAGSSARRTSCA